MGLRFRHIRDRPVPRRFPADAVGGPILRHCRLSGVFWSSAALVLVWVAGALRPLPRKHLA
jgi:hypothetical protein